MAKDPKPYARLSYSLTHGNIWLAVLSIMRRKRVYAYALPEEIKKGFGYSPSKLMAYFVLYKLEDEGMIASNFEGRRKYYEITKKGRQTLSKGKALLSFISRKL